MKDPQQARTLKRKVGKVAKTVTADYLIYLPKDYDSRSKTRCR